MASHCLHGKCSGLPPRGYQKGCSSSQRKAPLGRASELLCKAAAAVAEDNPLTAVDDLDVASSQPQDDTGWLWTNKPANTRAKMAQDKLRPKKSLAQNFVVDSSLLGRIVQEAGIEDGDLVLEIGPGTGNLTAQLLQAGATILAVEKDDTLAAKLQESAASKERLHVVRGDILRVDMPEALSRLRKMAADRAAASTSAKATASQQQRVKVVTNLPYNITTDVLKRMLPMGESIHQITMVMQHEVAQRLTEKHIGDGKLYRAMTVLAHYYSQPQYHFRIPASSFYPVPQVDGALTTFTLLPPLQRTQLGAERQYVGFVRQAFSSKRKFVANSLRPRWRREDIRQAMDTLQLSAEARPQDLDPSTFEQLYMELSAVQARALATDPAVLTDPLWQRSRLVRAWHAGHASGVLQRA